MGQCTPVQTHTLPKIIPVMPSRSTTEEHYNGLGGVCGRRAEVGGRSRDGTHNCRFIRKTQSGERAGWWLVMLHHHMGKKH